MNGGTIILLNTLPKKVKIPDNSVVVDPRIRAAVGLRKPDLLVVRGDEAVVLYAQITNDDGCGLDKYNSKKIQYYSGNRDLI